MSVTLETVKAHLRVDHADDDVMLAGLVATANKEVAEVSGVTDWAEHPQLATAAILIVASWYDGGEDTVGEMPESAQRLINLSKTGWFGA